jgi:hypothetical protein
MTTFKQIVLEHEPKAKCVNVGTSLGIDRYEIRANGKLLGHGTSAVKAWDSAGQQFVRPA